MSGTAKQPMFQFYFSDLTIVSLGHYLTSLSPGFLSSPKVNDLSFWKGCEE